jgi:hypothetical protein
MKIASESPKFALQPIETRKSRGGEQLTACQSISLAPRSEV